MPATKGRLTKDEEGFSLERLKEIVSWRNQLLELIDEDNQGEIERLAKEFTGEKGEEDKANLLNTRFLFIQEGTKGPGTELTILNYCIGKAHDKESLELYSGIAGFLMSQGAKPKLKDGKGNDYRKCKKVVREKIENPEAQQSSSRENPLSPPKSSSVSPNKVLLPTSEEKVALPHLLPPKSPSVKFVLGPPGAPGEHESDDPPLLSEKGIAAASFGPVQSQSEIAAVSPTAAKKPPSPITAPKRSPEGGDVSERLKELQERFNFRQ